eukprot:CAMPEP_0202359160 /NCGR_PEP_ID=MMETSP1126-20121109/12553_1 /ASSEMBLY_ACC=CAM_ASM_000457 /TAXON_ID=3047 /ORGANISM="Dunaliella tertiolecta, Strain CCMP1320" /LENGTH=72 /DNA_ID=CAMNT_0048952495 /DNA_START=1273 /DNA_END=1491 /DNA_ORIENTATION=-
MTRGGQTKAEDAYAVSSMPALEQPVELSPKTTGSGLQQVSALMKCLCCTLLAVFTKRWSKNMSRRSLSVWFM